MTKISKRKAFAQFKKGIPFIMVPSKCSPSSMLALDVDSDMIQRVKNEPILTFYHSKTECPMEENFGRFVANFYSYNCEVETGLRVAFWSAN